MCGMAVFFLYLMRRVNCSACGVKVERVPWADGKHQATYSYQVFLVTWAKRVNRQETARIFGTCLDTVNRPIMGRRLGVGPSRNRADRRNWDSENRNSSRSPVPNRWCTKFTQAAVGCCTWRRTERRRVFAGFSTNFPMPLCQASSLSVQICVAVT